MKMQIKMKVGERYAVIGILPQEGKFQDLKNIREVRELLSLTEAEKEAVGWTEMANGAAQWNDSKDEGESLVFVDGHLTIIKKAFKERESQSKLHMGLIDLYEKFVLEKGKGVKIVGNDEDFDSGTE